jgi:hypothetical protein
MKKQSYKEGNPSSNGQSVIKFAPFNPLNASQRPTSTRHYYALLVDQMKYMHLLNREHAKLSAYTRRAAFCLSLWVRSVW